MPGRAEPGLAGGPRLPRSGTREVVRLPVVNVATMLERQRSLTAVDRFSQHDGAGATADPLFYRDLIPLEKPRPGEQYSFEVDLDACTGCKACVAACHTLNGLDTDEVFRVTGLLRSQTPETPVAKAPVKAPVALPTIAKAPVAPVAKAPVAPVAKAPVAKAMLALGPALQTVTSSCHHCLDPACMTGCPVAAYEKDPLTGIVRHLDDQCIGCQYCTLMCPYDAPKYNESKGIVRKCDMCSDRLAHGQAPACAEACPSSAIAIRTVSKVQLEARLQGGFLPGVADPSQTLPTTRYVSRAGLEHFAPVDELRSEPQHAPASLVVMLTLTQLAAGVAAASALWQPSEPLPSRLVVASAAGLGVTASLFHLGRPWLAHRAVLGLRTSWLSREAVALGLFAKLAVGAAAQALLLQQYADAGTLLARLSAVLGVCGVWCSVMVYAATRRAHWSAARTAACFGAGTLLLGGMWTLLLRLSTGAGWGQIEQGLVAIVLVTATAQLAYAAISLRASAADGPSALARRVRSLRGPLRTLTLARYLGLGLAGVLGPLLLLCEPSGVARTLTAALCCCGLLASELCERHLFFAAAPPSRMPGSMK